MGIWIVAAHRILFHSLTFALFANSLPKRESDQSLLLVTHNRKGLSPERIGITTHDRAEISTIGVGAVNQAIKFFIIAKGYLAEGGQLLSWVESSIDGEEQMPFLSISN
ncbi:MAG: stage V sporulation protein S [Chloroflexi bacterium]|nr:stage V sporulation protein S [Chloroflexota bacterium]